MLREGEEGDRAGAHRGYRLEKKEEVQPLPTSLLPYCLTALLPYCPTSLCVSPLLPRSLSLSPPALAASDTRGAL